MKRTRPFVLLAAVLAILCGVLAACSSSDTPTRPADQGTNPPGTAPATATYVVTITSSRPQVVLGSGESALITVSVRRVDNSAQPPDGSTVTLTTTLGSLGDATSGSQGVILSLTGGAASVELFASVTTGTAVLRATIGDSSGFLNLPMIGSTTFAAAFLEPNVGTPAGGEAVVLRGQGFVAPVRVVFGLVDISSSTVLTAVADVVSVTPEAVTLITPTSPVSVGVGETLLVDVDVTNKVGAEDEVTQTLDGAFIYALGGSILQPAITSISPNTGPNEGGTRVRILGDGFVAPVQVLFGTGDAGTFAGVEAVVESVTRNEIRAITPAATGFGQNNLNSPVNVLVRNKETGFAGLAPNGFTYGSSVIITSVGPTVGSHLGGTIVTIFGQGFDEPVAVGLAGVAASIISVTGTEIIVRSNRAVIQSCQDVNGDVGVTNIESGASATAPGQWTYRATSPVVTNIEPNSAGGAGGAVVTITGAGFEDPVRVVFGGTVATNVVVVSSSTLSVTLPPFTAFDTESCDDNNDGTSGTRLLPTSVDVSVTNLFTECDDTFAGGFTFLPPSSVCEGDVGPPPPPTADFVFAQGPGFEVSFTDASLGAVTSRTWDFGGEGSSTATNPTFTFSGAGPHAVTLSVAGPGGTDSVTKSVTAVSPP